MPESTTDPQKGLDGIDYDYTCDECGQGFLTSRAHNAHQRAHSDDVIVASDGGEILEDQ